MIREIWDMSRCIRKGVSVLFSGQEPGREAPITRSKKSTSWQKSFGVSGFFLHDRIGRPAHTATGSRKTGQTQRRTTHREKPTKPTTRRIPHAFFLEKVSLKPLSDPPSLASNLPLEPPEKNPPMGCCKVNHSAPEDGISQPHLSPKKANASSNLSGFRDFF